MLLVIRGVDSNDELSQFENLSIDSDIEVSDDQEKIRVTGEELTKNEIIYKLKKKKSISEKYFEADEVILIKNDGSYYRPKKDKRITDDGRINFRFIDLDTSFSDIKLILEKIYKEYIKEYPDHHKFAHSFVGQWIFNTLESNSGDPVTSNIKRFKKSELDFLKDSAIKFIENNFGMGSSIEAKND